MSRYNTFITSRSNPVIKEALKIKFKRAKFRNEGFFIEGIHLVETALESGNAKFKTVFFTENFRASIKGEQLLKHISGSVSHLVKVSESIMSELCDTETPQGISAVISIETIRLHDIRLKDPALFVICDGIQDPGNLGTIIRISDAARANAVFALPGTCDVFVPKVIRSSVGSIFHLPVIYLSYDNLSMYIKAKGIYLFAAEAHYGIPLYKCDLRQPTAIVFGNEANGLSAPIKSMADSIINIPFEGRVKSINAAMAASICLYEAVRQRKGNR